jgi:hypothetical protein
VVSQTQVLESVRNLRWREVETSLAVLTRTPTPAAGPDDGIDAGQNCLEQMIAVGQAGRDRGRSDRALVAAMKPVDFGDGDDRPG